MAAGTEQRAIASITLDVLNRVERARAQRDLEGLIEREEQFKIDIAGRAEEFAIWTEVHLNFGVIFVDGSEKRDSPYDRPHFTYGAETEVGGPIQIHGCVTRWDVNNRGETTGCMLSVGVAATDASRKFRGKLHARFQGFGAPRDIYGEPYDLE